MSWSIDHSIVLIPFGILVAGCKIVGFGCRMLLEDLDKGRR